MVMSTYEVVVDVWEQCPVFAMLMTQPTPIRVLCQYAENSRDHPIIGRTDPPDATYG